MWDLFDILALIVRSVHAVSSALWIGGSIFYLIVLRPALRDAEKSGAPPGRIVSRLVALHFREWVHVSMIALLVSGAILTFDRLTEPTVSALYIGALAAKISIAFWLFGIGTATYRKKLIERRHEAGDMGGREKKHRLSFAEPSLFPIDDRVRGPRSHPPQRFAKHHFHQGHLLTHHPCPRPHSLNPRVLPSII